MRHQMEIFRPLITLLLIMQLSTISLLPVGGFVSLCFGSDGHFDISQKLCAENSQPHEFPEPSKISSSDDHHVDCMDVPIGCNDAPDEMLPSLAGDYSTKTKVKNIGPPSVVHDRHFSFARLTHSSIRTPPHLNGETLPPAHLVSLHTTLLLI